MPELYGIVFIGVFNKSYKNERSHCKEYQQKPILPVWDTLQILSKYKI